MSLIRVHIFIYGRVQGVFFRQSTLELARRLQATGYVRNRKNGSVEAVFEGEQLIIDEIISWCKKGPELASVKGIEIVSNEKVEQKLYEFFLIESTQ